MTTSKEIGGDSGLVTDEAVKTLHKASAALGDVQKKLQSLDRQAVADLLTVLRYAAKDANNVFARDNAARLLRRLEA